MSFAAAPAAQQQRRAGRLQARLQRPQRLREPPAAPPRRAGARPRLVQYVKANHRRAGARGGMQSGVVGKPQIVAEPDDDGRGVGPGMAIRRGNSKIETRTALPGAETRTEEFTYLR